MLTKREEGYLAGYRDELTERQRVYFDGFKRYLESQRDYQPRTVLQYLREYRLFLLSSDTYMATQRAIDTFFSTQASKSVIRRAMTKQLVNWTIHQLNHPENTEFEKIEKDQRLMKISELRLIDIPDVAQRRRGEKRHLSDAQVAAWIQKLGESEDGLPDWYLPIVLLLVDSGMRISEALSIRRKDLKQKDVIRVRTKGNNLQEKRVKPKTIETLREYAKMKKRKNDDLVFSESDDAQMELHTSKVRYYFRKYSIASKNVHPHMLRRYVASRLHRMHVETIIIQKILGHKNMSTTQHYIEIDQQQVDDAHRRYHEETQW